MSSKVRPSARSIAEGRRAQRTGERQEAYQLRRPPAAICHDRSTSTPAVLCRNPRTWPISLPGRHAARRAGARSPSIAAHSETLSVATVVRRIAKVFRAVKAIGEGVKNPIAVCAGRRDLPRERRRGSSLTSADSRESSRYWRRDQVRPIGVLGPKRLSIPSAAARHSASHMLRPVRSTPIGS